jgi:transposase
VQLSQRPGIQVQAVAEALDIHPLSRWRKEFREGRLRPATPVKARAPKAKLVREIRRLQALERAHQELQEEHALLKKFIRFTSARHRTSSRSSTSSGRRSGNAPLSDLRRHAGGLLRVAPPARQCAHEAGPGVTRGDACDLRAQWRDLWESADPSGPEGRGQRVSRRRIERLMRASGWRARLVRVYRPSRDAPLVWATSKSRAADPRDGAQSDLGR